MRLFSLVAIFLFGGFGIFYALGSNEQNGLVTLVVALAWCGLFLWLLFSTRSDGR
jgi:hypothetical protein